jgi:C4-dicarboxylate transporter
MCPAYAVYFALQILSPTWLTTLLERIACLAATASVHALVSIVGLLVFKWKERGQGLMADERDRAIDTHATRIAYYALMTGTILVGVVMPFNQGGWKIVNSALLAIVLAEVLRNVLIVWGYQGAPRLAQ